LAEMVRAMEARLEAKEVELLQAKAYFENQLAHQAAAMDQLNKQHEKALQALQEELNTEKLLERTALQAMHDEMEAKVAALLREKAAAVNDGLEKLAEVKHHEEAAIQEMEQRLREQMAEQKKQSDQRIASMQDQYQKLQTKCNERLQDKELQLQQLRDMSQEQLTQMQQDSAKARGEANSQIEELKQQKETAIIEVKKVHATQVSMLEVKIQETRTYHEERIVKTVREHNDALERSQKAFAMKERELSLAKEKAASKERELSNDVTDLEHDMEVSNKLHATALQDSMAEGEQKMKRKDAQIEDLQELMNRKLVELEDDSKKRWKVFESKLNNECAERINAVTESAQTKVDAAIALAKKEKNRTRHAEGSVGRPAAREGQRLPTNYG